MIEVNVMKAGQSFGELALITEQPRNATVYCKTECHFLVLDKDDYTQIIGRFDTDVLEERMEKIRHV
jgi:CRP-like cAMP-binding protein